MRRSAHSARKGVYMPRDGVFDGDSVTGWSEGIREGKVAEGLDDRNDGDFEGVADGCAEDGNWEGKTEGIVTEGCVEGTLTEGLIEGETVGIEIVGANLKLKPMNTQEI